MPCASRVGGQDRYRDGFGRRAVSSAVKGDETLSAAAGGAVTRHFSQYGPILASITSSIEGSRDGPSPFRNTSVAMRRSML